MDRVLQGLTSRLREVGFAESQTVVRQTNETQSTSLVHDSIRYRNGYTIV